MKWHALVSWGSRVPLRTAGPSDEQTLPERARRVLQRAPFLPTGGVARCPQHVADLAPVLDGSHGRLDGGRIIRNPHRPRGERRPLRRAVRPAVAGRRVSHHGRAKFRDALGYRGHHPGVRKAGDAARLLHDANSSLICPLWRSSWRSQEFPLATAARRRPIRTASPSGRGCPLPPARGPSSAKGIRGRLLGGVAVDVVGARVGNSDTERIRPGRAPSPRR